MAINTSDAVLKHQKKEQLRLQKYMEQVNSKLASESGDMLEYWQREATRTQKKLDSFV